MSASPRLVWPACNVVAAALLPARAGGRVWPVTAASTPRKVHAPAGLATPGATRQPGEQARPTAAPARRRQPHRRSRGCHAQQGRHHQGRPLAPPLSSAQQRQLRIAPGPVRRRTTPVVLDRPAGLGPIRNGKRGPAESRILRDPQRMEGDPLASQTAEHDASREPPLTRAHLVPDADAGTTAPPGKRYGRMRAAED
jgi:hypothetical protein